ncbi:UbiA prenyltransferase family [Xylariaceae sp. FL0804]|nr:UbiA prenyltransferase family [Xylariaceae sp. FL0804]
MGKAWTGHVVRAVLYHARTSWLFIYSDVMSIIGVSWLFGALSATTAESFALGPNLTAADVLRRSPAVVLWCWANLLLFNLHNQRHPAAVREDRANKPWRPLPAGRLTPAQATRAMYAMYPVALGVALATGGLAPCLLEAALCLWYNELGGSGDPFLKNALNGLGFACFLAGALEVFVGGGRSVLFAGGGRAARWLAVLAAAITCSSHLQDFRDVEGDRAVGRRTVPTVLGGTASRVQCALAVAASNLVACWFWDARWHYSAGAWGAGFAIAANLLGNRTRRGDVLSWRLFPLWMLGLFIVPHGV